MKIQLLLVDDHQLVRKGLRAILEKDGEFAVVDEAGSGLEAVQKASRLKPDVVLMDVVMAGMNGIEATRQILAMSHQTRIVALSSYSDRRYVNGMLRSGARGYVLKANAYDDLRLAVQAVAAGKTYLCADVIEKVVDVLTDLAGDAPSVYTTLGRREREVLQLVAEGLTSPAIGRRLALSTSTVDTHRRNLMRKLALHSVADLTKYALREGLISLEE